MRYELTDGEWAAIKAMLPNKPAASHGWMTVASSMASSGFCDPGAPWRDLPGNFGSYTTCYNRFVRWRRAGVWAKIMNGLAGAHDAAVQMIVDRPRASARCLHQPASSGRESHRGSR